MLAPQQNIVNVRNLSVSFNGNQPFEALKDVSFGIAAGETLALVGQSGSGKSVTALALMGLLPANASVSGSIQLDGYRDLIKLQAREWPVVRGKAIGMVFQEPMSALNPVKTCGYQLMESIRAHRQLSTKEARLKAIEWFEKVKLPEPAKLLERYPHQLSGGQKQRVVIAMAMCNHPSLLIADEPTTALDVTVQQEIVNLMKQLQLEYHTAMLFITHDLALARTITSDFMVMEKGSVIQTPFIPPAVKDNPHHYTQQDSEPPLLQVKDLSVHYPEETNWLGKTTRYFNAVNEVSFELYRGETLGLVGESGCGKSTLSKSILGLQQVTSGKVLFEGKDITEYNAAQWRSLRKDIQIIFQDPYASLNQRMKVGDALAEPITVHRLATGKAVDNLVDQLLEKVHLPLSSKNKYPHEFSGGQRQRICIARALAVKPKLVICDESVSALDVKIQAQILELLQQLQQEEQLTYLFITHDLTVVRHISNRLIVMQKGRIVELGDTEQVMLHPQQEYTRRLLAAVPGML
jgi:peptide/nickel transport system ATP-binding protein